jgi:hypothetical protein
MTIYPWELIPVNLYVNPKYEENTTICRLKNHNLEFDIQRVLDDGIITIDYETTFESIINCDILANASFRVSTKFTPSDNKDDDLIVIGLFLNEFYFAVNTYLQDVNNVPQGMIKLSTALLSENDIAKLKNDVFSELLRKSFYQQN